MKCSNKIWVTRKNSVVFLILMLVTFIRSVHSGRLVACDVSMQGGHGGGCGHYHATYRELLFIGKRREDERKEERNEIRGDRQRKGKRG